MIVMRVLLGWNFSAVFNKGHGRISFLIFFSSCHPPVTSCIACLLSGNGLPHILTLLPREKV